MKRLTFVMLLCLGLVTVPPAAAGTVTYERWTDYTVGAELGTVGTDPDGIAAANAAWLEANTPTVQQVNVFQMDEPDLDNYAGRITGWIVPPADGDYTFWLASDDDSRLWLSSDEYPATKTLICYIDGWCGWGDFDRFDPVTLQPTGPGGGGGVGLQKATVPLVGGQAYYAELMWSDGTGGGFGRVNWEGPIGGRQDITDTYLRNYQGVGDPNPADGVTEIEEDLPQLSWGAATIAGATFTVYLGPADGTMSKVAEGGTETHVDLSAVLPLDYATEYNWQVIVIDPNDGVPTTYYEGDVWSFTTKGQYPYLVSSPPAVNAVDPGGTLELTAEFTAEAPIDSYAWTKDGAPLSNGGNMSGADTPTLTISDFSRADNALYVCTATNGFGSASSAPAGAAQKDLVAWYAFEDTADDWSDFDHDGVLWTSDVNDVTQTPNPESLPVFIDGPVNRAVQFDGVTNFVHCGTWNPSDKTGQLTVSMWAQWYGLNDHWQGLIGKRDTWAQDQMMWQFEANRHNGNLAFNRHSGGGVGDGRLPEAYVIDRADMTSASGPGIVTYSTQISGDEAAWMLFDNTSETKWLTSHGNIRGWVAYQFPNDEAYVISAYAVTSANDAPDRDPKNWELSGSNDGENWVVLDTRTNESFPARFHTRHFSFANDTAYKMYKFDIKANNQSADLAGFSELKLYELTDDPGWTHLAVTFDGQSAVMYVNGQEVGRNDSDWSLGPDVDAVLSIGNNEHGANQNAPSQFFNGAVDEVRIYNYALDVYQVAQIYANESGETVCPTNPPLDFNGDCVVGLADLVMMLEEWMECNLSPISECSF